VLNQAKTLNGYKLKSLDGEIGKIEEFYFDDQYWTIRYLVVETGNWLTNKVLISPYALATVNQKERNIAINLTKKQIEDSPPLDNDKPVSRQFEEKYYGYYSWPMYWAGPDILGAFPNIPHNDEKPPQTPKGEKKWDPHLRSTRAVTGYNIQAMDGEIGHVDDFIIDEETWEIRYLIIDTGNWWSGKKILISPRWIKRISWSEAKVFVDLSRNTIKQSPEYVEGSSLSREYEDELHRHYNFQGYWVDEPVAKNDSH
jgi:uncharacterized protein YrrD